jgi:hypothetical protein
MTEQPRERWGPSNYDDWERKQQSTESSSDEPKEISFEDYIVQRLEYLPALEKYLQSLHDKIDKLNQALRSTPPPETAARAPPRPKQQSLPSSDGSLEDAIRDALPASIALKLHFTRERDYLVVKSDYLPKKEDFAELANVIRREFGGEYIRAGKNSRFEIPL